MDTRGFLFIATGKKYIKAAVRAAVSCKLHSPDIPIHLFANWQDFDFDFMNSSYPFSSVGKITEPHRRSKIDYLSQTPFERTLYFDSDIALNADVRDVFQILDRFDVALCHAHRRNTTLRLQPWKVELPISFPQFNSGVFAYRKTTEVINFLERWVVAYKEAGFPQDQRTLRELLWESDLRIATLPPEYNVRYMKYHILRSNKEAKTKIFHLRKYHDGSFWYLKRFVKRLLRPIYYRFFSSRSE